MEDSCKNTSYNLNPMFLLDPTSFEVEKIQWVHITKLLSRIRFTIIISWDWKTHRKLTTCSIIQLFSLKANSSFSSLLDALLSSPDMLSVKKLYSIFRIHILFLLDFTFKIDVQKSTPIANTLCLIFLRPYHFMLSLTIQMGRILLKLQKNMNRCPQRTGRFKTMNYEED